MSNIEKFSEGANILQQVDVSDIFKSLAFAIAEAQEKLDNNSISQVLRLADPAYGVGTGADRKSLLELGFAPTFYAFQYADISAKIHLKMRMQEEMEFGFDISFSLANSKGYSEQQANFANEDKYSELNSSFKSSRTLSFKSSEKKSVTIDNKRFNINEQLDVKERLIQFQDDIINQSTVSQIICESKAEKLVINKRRGVDVWIEGGFLRLCECLCFNKTGVGILKIRDFSTDKEIDVNGTPDIKGDFQLSTTLKNTFINEIYSDDNYPTTTTSKKDAILKDGANQGIAYGISKDGKLVFLHGTAINDELDSTIYFRFNKSEVEFGKNLRHGASENAINLPHAAAFGDPGQNHDKHKLIHQLLRMIQRNDPTCKITITGYADPVGNTTDDNNQNNANKPNTFNRTLARNRAKSVKEHIFGIGVMDNIEIVGNSTPGPNQSNLLDRKATIILDSDYIIFIGGRVNKNASPAPNSTSKNKFIYADDDSDSKFHEIDFTYGGVNFQSRTETDFTLIRTAAQTALTKTEYSNYHGRHYFLHENTLNKLYMYSSESDEISVSHSDEKSSERDESQDSFLSTQNINSQNSSLSGFKDKSGSKTFAMSGGLDFRMAKQFEMSVEGTASMSARLVAIPAPDGFMGHITNIFISGDNNSVTVINNP
jgi:hypothetical protein